LLSNLTGFDTDYCDTGVFFAEDDATPFPVEGSDISSPGVKGER